MEHEAQRWEGWFREAMAQADADPSDANADEELHSLVEWLHEYGAQTILFMRSLLVAVGPRLRNVDHRPVQRAASSRTFSRYGVIKSPI
jgi:hypothetical protein